MRPHHITITPRSVTIDGIPLTAHETGPTIEPLGPGLQIVHIPVIAEHATLQGDTHQPDEPTPIYDQLMEEKTKPRIIAQLIHPDGEVETIYRDPNKDTK